MHLFRSFFFALVSSAVLLPPSEAAAQGLPAACSLLTTTEVEAALGLSLRPPADMDTRMTVGPAKGQTIRSCVWPTGPQNGITLGVSPAMPSAAQPQSPQQHYEMFKKQGYKVDERIFGNGVCLAVTPPATARTKTYVTTCTLQAKGMQLVMMAPSTTNAVPSETVKKLVDLAVTRLP